MANFNLPFGVYISNNNPIDSSRYIVNDLTERGNLITFGRAFEGLQTYVKSEKKLYILKNLSPVSWELVPDASSMANNDASINGLYTQIGNLDSSIDMVWTKIDGSLFNVDSSLGAIWVKLGYVDISLNNIDFSSLEASINDIWVKLDDVDISLNDIYANLGNLDSSMNGVWIKTSYLESSVYALDIKNQNQDTSLNSIWTKIGNQDSSFNLFLPTAGGTLTGSLNISAGGLNVTNDVSVSGTIYANNIIADGSTIFNGPTSFINDVFFEGSAYFVDVNTLDISTSFIDLNTGLVGPPPLTLQSGVIINRGSENPYIFVYDEDIQTFRIGISYLETPTHYSDASTQAVATRENDPSDNFIGYWSASENMFRFRSPDSIADVSKFYVDTEIGYVESSINDIYEYYLDGEETISRTIYIDPSGNDLTGDGTQTLPFASFLKAVQTIKPYVNANVNIAIDVSAGNYNVDMLEVDKHFNKIYFSRNSTFRVYGKFSTDVSSLTITAGSNLYEYNVTGAVFTTNQYQDYFMTNGTTNFPIVHNDPSIIYSNVGAAGCHSIIHNTTVFNLTDGNFFLNTNKAINGQTFEFYNVNLNSSSNVRFSGNPIIDIITSKINATSGSVTSASQRLNFNSCAFILSSSGWTNETPKVQYKQCSIRKSGAKSGTGLTENQNYTIQLTSSFGLYIYNWTTALAYQAGFFIANLTNGALVFDNNTNGISIRNSTNLSIGQNVPLYLKDVSTLLTNGETLYGNYIVAINSLVGVPSIYASTAISALGYSTPSKNISVNIPGITQTITFPDGTTQSTSFDASANALWTKIGQIDTSIVDSDSSMWAKFGNVDTSITNVDSSIDTIWLKLGQVDNSLNNVETGVGLFNWDISSGTINVDMSKDKRIKLTLNGNVTMNLTNLSSIYSRSVVMDVKATGTLRTITWDASLTTNNWADGEILSGIDTSTYAFVININTNGSDKSDVTLNWIKKGL